MPAMLGPYGMSREASGTAWQPDSSPVLATMFHAGDWMGMAQGNATLVHSDQGGPRGDQQNFVESMAMVMANRPIGDHGRLGLRGMLSLDPLMGRRGYPLLFAVGETADGVNKLVDRQHPHDLFMELAVSYSHDLAMAAPHSSTRDFLASRHSAPPPSCTAYPASIIRKRRLATIGLIRPTSHGVS